MQFKYRIRSFRFKDYLPEWITHISSTSISFKRNNSTILFSLINFTYSMSTYKEKFFVLAKFPILMITNQYPKIVRIPFANDFIDTKYSKIISMYFSLRQTQILSSLFIFTFFSRTLRSQISYLQQHLSGATENSCIFLSRLNHSFKFYFIQYCTCIPECTQCCNCAFSLLIRRVFTALLEFLY